MKLACAIIWSLLLAGTPILLAQTPLPECVKQPIPACCQHGCKMPCCSAKPASNSQPVPAMPAQTGNQGQISLFAANSVATWVLPDAATSQPPSDSPTTFVTEGSPLYARNCAWLI